MDAVITYVNGADPLWHADYKAFAGEPMLAKRFRDWGTLRYLFRGIESNMPFVDRVFLVVSRESQVPDWVNRETVTVVLHKDFIPEDRLPTFNASMIEMFLHRIPGLGERFLYLNDDIFPLRPVVADDLYKDGRPAKKMSLHLFAPNAFKRLCRCSDRAARKASGKRPSPFFLRPQHSITPMLKSVCEEVFQKLEPQIMESLSPVRRDGNFNQYLFSDYLYYTGRAVSRRISHKHCSLAVYSAKEIAGFILEPKTDFVCINDVEMPQMRFVESREVLMNAFALAFPNRSRYEREA